MAENSLWAREINGDDDEDEALRIAIAMSLGEEAPERKIGPKPKLGGVGAGHQQPIDLTQDEDDIETASEASPEPEQSMPGNKQSLPVNITRGEDGMVAAPAAPPAGGMAMLGLDRKKMEEERLARLGKRKAVDDPNDGQGSGRPTQRLKTEDEALPVHMTYTSHKASTNTPNPSSKANRTSAPSSSRPSVPSMPNTMTKPSISTPSTSSDNKKPSISSKLPFPQGVVKKTWCHGQPRLGDDIKIEEVLQKDQLELAVISSFQWDPDFLVSKIDLSKTRICLIAYAPDEAEQEAIRASLPNSRARFCFPPMNGPGNMHSKLQILKFADYLRIVVPTGNFVPYDWGETGVMENMLFLIDLPRINDQEARETDLLTPFGQDLCYFLQAQGVDDGLIRSLVKYDFSETAKYGFVHSIAGSHGDDAWRRTGYCGLGRSVHTLGLSTKEPIEVDIVCSSLGAINFDMLRMMYNACQGDAGMKEYVLRTSKKSGDTSSSVSKSLDELRSHMRVYFPSEATIASSIGGKHNAGTIFFMTKWWTQTTFPKAVLRDCKSTRRGILMHNKLIFVRHQGSDSTPAAGFAYVGSANLSESAWGKLTKDRATGKPKMTCRNWECGVVVPVSSDKATDMAIFNGHVPVPMQVPGAPYLATETRANGSRAIGGIALWPWCMK